ncbi:MAG: RnfABCDGE type electron transport complex subunit G [Pseudomonadota bacterium]
MTGPTSRLAALALAAGLLLSATHALTGTRVAANRDAYAARQLLQIVGRDDVTVRRVAPARYALMTDTELTGFIFEVTTRRGYNGRIELWLGVNLAGQVEGVRVKHHEETPGLGDKIDLAVSDWILGFNGYRLEASSRAAWNVIRDGGDFDQFSGATITPRAVIHAVRDGLEEFETQKTRWITEVESSEL